MEPAGFLIPLSYASQFGGVCTLIGTSTNLLVHSLAQDAGQPGFTMFEFTALGLLMFLVGTTYVLVVSRWLLPHRGGEIPDDLFVLTDFMTELEVDHAIAGKSVDELDLQERFGLIPLDLIRGGDRFWRPGPVRLEAGDLIRVSGAIKNFTTLAAGSGLRMHGERFLGEALVGDKERRLIEVLVPPQSPLLGHSARELGLARRWNAILLAMRRQAQPTFDRLSDIRLQVGDVLLIMTTREGAADLLGQRNLVVLSDQQHALPRARSIAWPIGNAIAVVAVAAMGWMPIYLSALIGCASLLLTRSVTSEEAIEAVDWRVLLLIAGMLPLGVAMQNTGLADNAVNAAFGWIGYGSPYLALALVYLATAVMTELMSNNAAAVLIVPVGMSVADHLGLDAKPFMVAITFAASTSFATPVGYQTNTMVYNAGNYRFADFIRIGLPLNIIFWVVASFAIPRFFPFSGA